MGSTGEDMLGAPPPAPPTYGLRDRPLTPVDRYGFSGAAVLEPSSYRDAVVHPEWQHAMAKEITALERTSTWDIVSLPPVFVPSLVSGYTRLRLAPMVSLSATKLALWPVAFSRSMILTTMRHLLLWPT